MLGLPFKEMPVPGEPFPPGTQLTFYNDPQHNAPLLIAAIPNSPPRRFELDVSGPEPRWVELPLEPPA